MSSPAAASTSASASSSDKKKGECKWFNSKKGFGFITPSDGSEDIFVHQSAIHAEGFRSLAEKEPVEFDTAIDENGRVKALSVTGPGGAYVQGAPKPRSRYNRSSASDEAGTDGSAAPRGRGGYRGRGGRRGGRGKPSGDSGADASASSAPAPASSQ